MKALIGKIGGRKFVVTLVGMVVVVVANLTGWDLAAHQESIVKLIMVYVGGQAIADGLSGGKTSTTNGG
jgi:hypothetical protein